VAEFLPVLLFFGVIATVIVLTLVYHARAERQRTEAMRAIADGFGFEYEPDPDLALLDDVRSMHLFAQGRRPQLRNMMWGTTHDLGVAIFDYTYTIGGGKNQQTIAQTVIRFLAADLSLPAFTLRPESFWHRLGQFFGLHDINFDTHPVFSKAYQLKGKDEEAIREVFTDEVLEYFEDHPGLSVEAAGPRIVFYRSGTRVEPDKIRELMEQGFEVLAVFRSATRRK
jgi:hypothetical protein